MNKNKLKINQLIDIELEVVGEEGNISYESFPSRIEDKTPDYLAIAFPFKNGYPLPIHTGEVICLRFIQDDKAYVCEVKVVSKQTSPVALLKVTMPEKIVHIQKRNWVRLPYNTSVNYRMHDYKVDFSQATSLDISGGGILLQTKHPLDINDLLDIEFCLENILIATVGKVVRCIEAEKSYRIAIKFEKIMEKDRDKIVGFIFRKQREFIKKGLV